VDHIFIDICTQKPLTQKGEGLYIYFTPFCVMILSFKPVILNVTMLKMRLEKENILEDD